MARWVLRELIPRNPAAFWGHLLMLNIGLQRGVL